MHPRLDNDLRAERLRRRWTQTQAAQAAGITRQAYAAIESGRSMPSADVALRLAAAWALRVEDLFRLPEAATERVRAAWAVPHGREATSGNRVRTVTVGARLVAHATDEAVRPMPPADGIVLALDGEDVEIELLRDRPAPAALAVVGCDPAFGIVAETLRRERGIEVLWSPRGSCAALEALARGEAHVAGAHLHDPDTGEANGPWIREIVPFPCARIAFAVWEEGLLVRPGNPHGIRTVEDLARAGIRFLNREPGSGSRALLDEALDRAGVPASGIEGYDTAARGHLAVGEAVAAGLADAGIGIRAAGAAFGLDVLPLRSQRYELVIPHHFLDLPAVGALLDTMGRRGVRAQVEALQGYDASEMGAPV